MSNEQWSLEGHYGPRAAALIRRQRRLVQLENTGRANTAEDEAELQLLTELALMIYDVHEAAVMPGENHTYFRPEDFTERTLPLLCHLVRWRETQIQRASDLGGIAGLRPLTADEQAELEQLEALLSALFLDGKAYPISQRPLPHMPRRKANELE